MRVLVKSSLGIAAAALIACSATPALANHHRHHHPHHGHHKPRGHHRNSGKCPPGSKNCHTDHNKVVGSTTP